MRQVSRLVRLGERPSMRVLAKPANARRRLFRFRDIIFLQPHRCRAAMDRVSARYEAHPVTASVPTDSPLEGLLRPW
jgi:hypothetical protein